MKINLSELNESMWVNYKGDVWLEIRPLPASKNKELEKECTDADGKIDRGKLNEVLPDYVIKSWKGLLDQDDQPIPCTLEMKIAITDHFHNIRLWALNTAINLAEVKQEEQKKKASDSSKT